MILEEKKVSRRELAEKIGMSKTTIDRICNTENWPSDVTLQKIADALRIMPQELFCDHAKMTIEEAFKIVYDLSPK